MFNPVFTGKTTLGMWCFLKKAFSSSAGKLFTNEYSSNLPGGEVFPGSAPNTVLPNKKLIRTIAENSNRGLHVRTGFNNKAVNLSKAKVKC